MDEEFVERPVCPSCGGPPIASPHFSAPYGEGEVADFITRYYDSRLPVDILYSHDLVIEQCQSCSLYWHRFILNQKNLGNLYTRWIDTDESSRKARSATVAARINTSHLIAETLPAGGKDVLDFGGGWGNWCRCALALGCNVTALEADDSRRKSFPDEVCVLSDLNQTVDRSFDLINANQVFEHLPDPRGSIDALATKLKPGGALFISVPTARRSDPVIARGPFHPPEHINGFTPRALRLLILSAGLQPTPVPARYAEIGPKTILRKTFKNIAFRLAPDRAPSTALVGIAR